MSLFVHFQLIDLVKACGNHRMVAVALSFLVIGLISIRSLSGGEPVDADVLLLDGKTISQPLIEMNESGLSLGTTAEQQKISLDRVLEIRFPATRRALVPEGSLAVQLVDGSQLAAEGLTVAGPDVALKHRTLGSFKLPANKLKTIRFAAADPQVEAGWSELQKRASKKDMVVIRKQDVLDHLDGVIGAIDEQSIRFVLDGEEVPIKREKVYGLIYVRKEAAASPSPRVELTTGEAVAVTKPTVAAGQLLFGLGGSGQLGCDLSGVKRIDFSAGKVVYLSNLEPKDVRYVPFFDFIWEYRRDRNFDGKPLTLGNKPYAKGLAIHSRTTLRYRLPTGYRRLQGLVGIDDEIRVENVALVQIKGDGQGLFQKEVRGGQGPEVIDVEIAGLSELEIYVDYGSDGLDIGDRVHLADIRLVK
jgi:NPCBM/NEW2 domain